MDLCGKLLVKEQSVIYKLKNSEIVFEKKGVIGKQLLINQKNEIVHLVINKGEEIAGHFLDLDIIFYIIEGSGIITIDNKKFELEKNDVITVTKGAKRAWKNNSNNNLVILGIKSIN